MNLWVIFLTGLTVGGLTCLAVQGGLLASLLTSREQTTLGSDLKKHALFATGAFLLAKFIAYSILGFILGAFGGALTINETVQTLMQFAAGVYMIAVAGNLLNIHPVFRYVIIQPPRFLTRLVHNQSKSKDVFAPALLGAMTIFIPCGTTIAMEALAISSGNALQGAAILMAFTLGTIPLFLGIGAVTSILGERFRSAFLKVAAILVFYLGLMSINGSLVALGVPSILSFFSAPVNVSQETTQTATIDITSSGYSPNYIRVKQGLEVLLTLKTKNTYTCATAFRIPSLGISKNLSPNETQTVAFTPKEKGKIRFNCSMGMYDGIIEVL